MRTGILLFLVLFATGAQAREARLPVPPIPPAHQPSGAAPVPDLDVRVPFVETQRSRLTLNSDINHRAAPAAGLGFSAGARYQIDNDRRFSLPGLMMHMPFP